jgi:hypothetical protein
LIDNPDMTSEVMGKGSRGAVLLPPRPFASSGMLVGTRYQAALAEKRACDYFERSKAGIKAVFNVTAMERSILAELFERGGRGQLSGLRDRRPIERLVNKGFVERHTLNSQQEEYVLTAIGKKVLDNK